MNHSPPTIEPHLDEHELAGALRISVATLRKHRSRGTGPEYVKLGRCVRYQLSAALKWADESRVIPSSHQGRA